MPDEYWKKVAAEIEEKKNFSVRKDTAKKEWIGRDKRRRAMATKLQGGVRAFK